MDERQEDRSAAVPRDTQRAQQAEEIHARWRWVEPSVWTVRMLTALEQGVKGGKWFRLFDKIFSERNLHAAFQQVAKNQGAAGVDHVSIGDFERRLPGAIQELSAQLQAGTYGPQPVRRVHIPKPGTNETRPLGIPTVRDRVVQAAVVNVIEPIFERHFAEHSYGFRPGRGCKDALRRVDALVTQGYVHVVDADLKGYFDSIPHDRLMNRVQERIADGPTMRLIDSFLKADILDDAARWTPEAGAPQGAVLSPLLSNVYLDPLDHLMAGHGFEMVRYADDFVILCRTAEDAARALEIVRQWGADNGLTLHPAKTRIVDVRTGRFDFLGYTFHGHDHWPRDKSLKNVRDAIRARTKRTTGDSLQCVVARVNPVLRGWFAYFQHSTYHNVFVTLDGWVRRRLRSILRKQSKRHGIGKGLDHQRWPNRFFAGQGLFSLTAAHAAAVQSSRR
jgi:RNA-directed DNA polymerase